MKHAFLIISLSALLLSACSPNVETRGHVFDPDWKEHVHEGQTTREELLALLGSPSTTSSFGDEAWYYITTKREYYGFLKPDVTEDSVTRFVFDIDGKVKSVDSYDTADMRDIQITKRITPTEGHQMTVIEQMLGNLGRFNSPAGSGQQPGGRSGGITRPNGM